MKFPRFILGSAAVGIGAIGIGYLLAPTWMYGLYGISIASVNEANMVRGAYGGLFIASALLFMLGAIDARRTVSALIYLLTFMLGFAGGRTVSMVVDGIPSGLILLLMGLELVYITLATWALYTTRSNKPPSGSHRG